VDACRAEPAFAGAEIASPSLKSAIMKKPTSRSKPAGPLTTGEPQKDARPERFNRARPARDNNPEPNNPKSHPPPPGNSTIHNGSGGAFDATEEVRDDEDNGDFAREND
jgi:hypothetical protein